MNTTSIREKLYVFNYKSLTKMQTLLKIPRDRRELQHGRGKGKDKDNNS